MALRDTRGIQRISSGARGATSESPSMLNQPNNLGKKQTGKPSAGNPHAGFDEAGIGAGPTVALLGHSHEETGSNRSAKPKGTAPILDPTRG